MPLFAKSRITHLYPWVGLVLWISVTLVSLPAVVPAPQDNDTFPEIDTRRLREYPGPTMVPNPDCQPIRKRKLKREEKIRLMLESLEKNPVELRGIPLDSQVPPQQEERPVFIDSLLV